MQKRTVQAQALEKCSADTFHVTIFGQYQLFKEARLGRKKHFRTFTNVKATQEQRLKPQSQQQINCEINRDIKVKLDSQVQKVHITNIQFCECGEVYAKIISVRIKRYLTYFKGNISFNNESYRYVVPGWFDMASNTRPRTKALALGSSNRSTKLSALVSCLISRPAKPISRSNVNVASIKWVIEEQKIENLDLDIKNDVMPKLLQQWQDSVLKK
ncbi:hypothetical protein PGB90_002072 [Kerria lacca]